MQPRLNVDIDWYTNPKQKGHVYEGKVVTDCQKLSVSKMNDASANTQEATIFTPSDPIQNKEPRTIERVCFNCKDLGHFYVDLFQG